METLPTNHKHETLGMYSIDSLASPYCASALMCRLFGVHNSSKFSIDMVPLMEAKVHNYIMDWENIISDKMVEILEYRRKRFVVSQVIPPFYFSAYIMETIYFNSKYPIFGWKQTPQDPNPVHIYHKELWKAHYKNHLYRICNGFILPIHYSLFNKPAPRISKEADLRKRKLI